MVSLSLLSLVASALATQATKQTSAVNAQAEPSHAVQAQVHTPGQNDAINYSLEMAAIQLANYRTPGVSHEEAVQLARHGLGLYAKQAPIDDLASKAFSFYGANKEAITSGEWRPTAEDGLRAAKMFEAANNHVAQSANFGELNSFLEANLNKFDLGAGMKDIKRMAAVNPENARKAIKAVQDKVSESSVHQETYDTLLNLAKSFASKYNVDQTKFDDHFDMIANAIYEN